jgi:hypothetical protein
VPLAGDHFLLPILFAGGSINAMRSRSFLRFRMAVIAAAGCFLLEKSFEPGVLHSATEAKAVFAHIYLAFFGLLFLLQAHWLRRKLR